jgi:hypothetical protein
MVRTVCCLYLRQESKHHPFTRLRVHATQEWHDLYQKSTNDDLQKFLDHYLKSIDNGWEKTPKVRVSLLQYNEVSPNSSTVGEQHRVTHIGIGANSQPRIPRLACSVNKIRNFVPQCEWNPLEGTSHLRKCTFLSI